VILQVYKDFKKESKELLNLIEKLEEEQ